MHADAWRTLRDAADDAARNDGRGRCADADADAAAGGPGAPGAHWLAAMLARNAPAEYLRRHGAPHDVQTLRERLPIVGYDDLAPELARVAEGAADVLFAGRPVAYERTGGSSGGSKLIPYTEAGLNDFRRAALPWLADMARRWQLRGSAYLALSPATRAPETIGAVPVGLPDGAYLGATAAHALARVLAVPPEVGAITEVATWRARTLAHLRAAQDLELISVWSPTFLLRLLDDLPDPRQCWPRLKLVSCWTEGQAAAAAAELAARLPHAQLQPKGLMSTECMVTVPDAQDRAVLNSHGYFEFAPCAQPEAPPVTADALVRDAEYEVIATTASGLYRYRTGDRVRCTGFAAPAVPVLAFIGRGDLCCDLVGEKLTEAFVGTCLNPVAGFRFLAPAADGAGYMLFTEAGTPAAAIDAALCGNPQYAYARRIGQLRALRVVALARLFDRYAAVQLARGTRLGDLKPIALRRETDWLQQLESTI